MKGRSPTVEEKEWMDDVFEIGCIVCLEFMSVFTPCEVHHLEGKTKPGAHLKTIGLCSLHHRHKSNDGQWVSRHGDGKAAFEAEYAKEERLVELVRGRVKQLEGLRV